MSQWSSDGACIPSWLGMTNAYALGSYADALAYDNSSIKFGYVTAVHYPLDKNYESATEITYDVVAVGSVGLETATWHHYTNCKLGFGLNGTQQEFLRMTLRAPKDAAYNPVTGLTQKQIDHTTAVYLQCENGLSQSGVIVGFARHPSATPDSKTLGHNYRWDFNGISTTISKDGEYAVTYSGAILDPNNNEYVKPDANKAGTYLKFTKDGSFIVDDAKGESMWLDKTSKMAWLLGRNVHISSSEKTVAITAKTNVEVAADVKAIFNGKKVFIGKDGSTEPLVKGNKLAEALKQLVTILANGPIGALGAIPVATHPAVMGQLKAWSQIYGAKNVSPFLSKKGYVE